jgi:hypothetical protein
LSSNCHGGQFDTLGLPTFAPTHGSAHDVRKFEKSAAAARSTGLRLLHFSNPEGFRGCQPAGMSGHHYIIVMIGKTNFGCALMIPIMSRD